jgi:hypothetical protein
MINNDLEILDDVTKHLSLILSELVVRNEKKNVHSYLKIVRYERKML